MNSRRKFLTGSAAALSIGALGGFSLPASPRRAGDADDKLIEALERPVLKKELFPDPVIIESLDLLRNGDYYIVRARSTDGAEGYAVSNEDKMYLLWPIFVDHVGPFFEGKDVRELDALVQECFIDDSFYKFQSLAIWVPIASAEFAILDLLGKVAGRSVGELLGEVIRPEIAMYLANNFRGRSAKESVERIKERYERTRPPAIKFKVAGRMSESESPPGRSEEMIPMVREALGDDVVIYADANGGYGVEEAIRIGRMLEKIDAGFFEEPVPFDYLWETKEVADALDIPIAGGEQEDSLRRFRWMASADAVQVFQPDLFYYGGMIRSIQVARMAEAIGRPCTPHMSGAGLGMLYVLHYASIVPNAGAHQEYKGPNKDIPYETSPGNLDAVEGVIPVPTGPGLGVTIDLDWMAKSEILSTLP